MKNDLFSALLLLLPAAGLHAQAVSINTDASNPHPSALLDVKSTAKGMLVPRMTSAQRATIASPATGLLVFDTDTGSFWFYTGSAWTDLSAQKQLADADKDTKIQVEESPDEDIIRFDLAGAEKMVLRQNAAGAARLELPDPANNTIIGQNAGTNTAPMPGVSGKDNTFLGYLAGYANTSGQANTFLGNQAGQNTAGGRDNTAAGALALYANTTGSQNTAAGRGALGANSTGWYNTAAGFDALAANTDGYFNTAGGVRALFSNTNGFHNTAQGYQALYSNTTGRDNTALGTAALYSNTDRSNLVAVGDSALFNNGLGYYNTAVGSKALCENTDGHYNTAHGYKALYSNTSGSGNTAHGYLALSYNTSGSGNTGIGYNVGISSVTGNNNTNIGLNNYSTSANPLIASGSNNTTVGAWTGAGWAHLPFGSNNTFIGVNAGSISVNSNKLTLLGANTNLLALGLILETATAIGYNAQVSCSNCLVLGGTGPDSVDVGIGLDAPVSDLHIVQKNAGAGLNKLGVRLQDRDGTFWNTYVDFYDDYNFAFNSALTAYIQDGTGTYVAVSDARLKTNVDPLGPVLDNVLKLKPKWYHCTGFTDRPKTPGFMAQEVENVFPEIVFEKDGIKGLAYDYFGVLAIKAIQEQQALIEAQGIENAALKAQVAEQAAQLRQIAAALQRAGIVVEQR